MAMMSVDTSSLQVDLTPKSVGGRQTALFSIYRMNRVKSSQWKQEVSK